MAWSKCYNNCTLTGPLDAFCLVCESHVRTENDLDAHFEKPIHKKNLNSTPYLEKYKDDHIRKVKRGYYCEFCNMLFFTAAKVGLHIAESQHQYNRSSQSLKRVNNMVYAFDNVIIGDREWNGFVDDTCTVCNMEFENESIHKTGQNHTLNLILKKIEFIEDKLVYRQIDESSFQCMTCNLVLAIDNLTAHAQNANHLEKLEISRDYGHQGLKGIETPAIKTVNEVTPAGTPTRTNPMKMEQNDTNKDSKANIKAEPKKAEGSSKRLNKDNIKNPAELEKYICTVLNAKNYVVSQENGKSMCLLCDWCMDTDMVPSHVSGRHHLTIQKMHQKRLDSMCDGDQEPKPKIDKKDSNEKKESDVDKKEISNEKKEPKGGKKDSNDENKGPKVDKKNSCTHNQQPDQKASHGKTKKASNDKNDDDRGKVLDSLADFQKNDININFEIGIATCKKCSKSLNLAFDIIQSHIQEHKNTGNKKETQTASNNDAKKKPEPTKSFLYSKPVALKQNEDGRSSRASSISSTRDEEQIEAFAKDNNLTFTDGKLFCPLCNSKLPTALKNLKEHLLGAMHNKNKLAQKSDSDNAISLLKHTNLIKVPTNRFITSMIGLENDLIQDIIINEKFNLNILSFLMITSENFTLKCQPCEVVLQPEAVDSHKVTPNHIKAMTETMVITSIDGEFIREPRPEVFHCGFCAKVEHGWDDFEEHLTTNAHRGKRTAAMWRLREHMAQVARERWQRAMGFMAFMNMFSGHESSSDDEWY